MASAGVVSTQRIANTPDLTNINHYCVVYPGSQLPLNVSVSFDFELTIMPSIGIFFSLDTHARTVAPAHIFQILRFGHILCSRLMNNDLLRIAA